MVERSRSNSLMDAESKKTLLDDFLNYRQDADTPVAVAAIHALTGVLERSNATTMMEIDDGLKAAANVLIQHMEGSKRSTISLKAATDLFLVHVTRTFLEHNNFDQCREMLIQRGRGFSNHARRCREIIAKEGDDFIQDGMVVLIHGFSRMTFAVLTAAYDSGKKFEVIVTEGRPLGDGYKTVTKLQECNIPAKLIVDSAIGYALERADIVLVGAEGVVENGGVVNRMGTYTLAMAAKAMNRRFYVAAESYKFARVYPLHQRDVPGGQRNSSVTMQSEEGAKEVEVSNPSVDYTPPEYIHLLFTDLGVFTPSAVSDELMQLYQ